MAQSIASRPKRQQQTQPDDVVLARVFQFTEWARRNVVIVVVAAVVLAAIVAGLLWYRAEQARQREAAAIAFLQVEQGVMSGDEGIATRELELFLQRHSGTSYADEARVLLAQVHLRAGRPAEAAEVLQPLADRIGGSVVGAQAGLLLAMAYEAADRPDDAIAAYLRVANEAEMEFRQEEGLLGAARLREQTGDFAGAAELYGRLVEQAPEGSQQRSMYEMRLTEAAAQASAQ